MTNNLATRLSPQLRAHYDDLAATLSRWLEGQSALSQPKAPIFHYCALPTFESILSGSAFWFTSLYTMPGDPLEFGEGFAISRRVLESIGAREGAIGDLFCRPILGAGYEQSVRDNIEIYSASLSCRDDPPQWDSYGDNRRGVSVGFSPRIFETYPASEHSPNEIYWLGAVQYDRAVAEALLREPIEIAFEAFKRAQAEGAITCGQEAADFIQAAHVEMQVSTLHVSATTKRATFAHERETRLLTYNHLKCPGRIIRHRQHKGIAIHFVEIEMPLRQPGNIVDVMIGRDAPADTEARLATMFASLGMALPPLSRSAK